MISVPCGGRDDSLYHRHRPVQPRLVVVMGGIELKVVTERSCQISSATFFCDFSYFLNRQRQYKRKQVGNFRLHSHFLWFRPFLNRTFVDKRVVDRPVSKVSKQRRSVATYYHHNHATFYSVRAAITIFRIILTIFGIQNQTSILESL